MEFQQVGRVACVADEFLGAGLTAQEDAPVLCPALVQPALKQRAAVMEFQQVGRVACVADGGRAVV